MGGEGGEAECSSVPGTLTPNYNAPSLVPKPTTMPPPPLLLTTRGSSEASISLAAGLPCTRARDRSLFSRRTSPSGRPLRPTRPSRSAMLPRFSQEAVADEGRAEVRGEGGRGAGQE